jgi:hypothetical protein
MTDDIEWLVQEISDLLDAGQVGLYEFVWVLHQRYPDAPAASLLHICRPVLDEFLKDPAVQLGWYVWPSSEPIRPASRDDLTDHAFDDIGPDPYLGIERV